FTYNASTEPSVFSGKLGSSILESFKTIGKRFTYGGDTAHDQRVYYFNTKESWTISSALPILSHSV
ncbi:MAG: hypothetical protein KBS81_02475, partial [Spirochaetales bacterium]|nr:hypothetical protein [Candidatus Physcosoma equi]